MRKTVPLLTIMAMLCIGCQTPTGQRDIAPAIKTAAYMGTAYAILENPSWRKGFEEAVFDLKLLEAAETIDFTMVLSIVNRLPVKELRSSKAAILITSATILLSDYGGSLPLDQFEKLKLVVKAMREGIELGLGPTPANIVVEIQPGDETHIDFFQTETKTL